MTRHKPNKKNEDLVVEQEMSGLKIYLRLLQYLKPNIWIFLVSIFGFLLFAGTAPMLAKLMGVIIQAIEHRNADARWTLPALAIGVFALRGVGSFLGNYFNALVSCRVIYRVRVEMFSHLTTLPVVYFDKNSDGKILQRLSGSINLLSNAITDTLKTIIREGLTILFLLGFIFYLNWKLSLIFLLVAPLVALLVRYTTKRFRSIMRQDENVLAGLMQSVKEMISGHEVMRVFQGQEYEKLRYNDAAQNSFDRRMKIVKVSALSTPVMQLIIAVAMAGIIFMLLMPDTLAAYTSAELITYLTSVALLPKSMRQLGGINAAVQRGITGAQLIFDLLDTAAEEDNGTFECVRAKGVICISDVKFRYNKKQDFVLKGISFEMQPGEMVALVGKSGSGKSTIAALLQRFYSVDAGAITLDGVDIRDYQLASLRKQISLVSQNLVLFNDSIRNNIAYGAMGQYDDEAVLYAAKQAHALEFIEALPNGLDTMIGNNGLQLSGGQRQRIAIARAFLKDAPILVFDEATSALDGQSESMIQHALERIMTGRTTLVIAHRLSTVEKANKILVMNNGAIVEQGTHKELLALENGYYKNLYQSSDKDFLAE